jgi:hypothetical protein
MQPSAKAIAPLLAAVVALGAMAGPALAVVNAVFPSTNDANRSNGWAHVEQASATRTDTTLVFTNPRAFQACFEVRTDGDATQRRSPLHFNPGVTDGLYPFFCLRDASTTRTFAASDYVEVRLAFGAETDERFDWTRFDLAHDPQSRAECKDGGWEAFGFRNQGLCVAFVETGRDPR